MVPERSTQIKLETNRTLAWFQCHPRASVYLFVVGLVNILLNLADLLVG